MGYDERMRGKQSARKASLQTRRFFINAKNPGLFVVLTYLRCYSGFMIAMEREMRDNLVRGPEGICILFV